MLYKNDNFRICAYEILYTFTIYIHELNLQYSIFRIFYFHDASLQILRSKKLLHLQIYESRFIEFFY